MKTFLNISWSCGFIMIKLWSVFILVGLFFSELKIIQLILRSGLLAFSISIVTITIIYFYYKIKNK